jgi:omega-amidase
VNIIGLQPDIVWEDKQTNFRTVRRLLERSTPRPKSLVVLPEMFATGFSMNVGAVAEPHQGETEEFLGSLAKAHQLYLIGGVAVRGKDGDARNKALLFGPAGELAGFYSKMRPFSVGGEAQHYMAGDRIMSFTLEGTKVAPFICYDLRFPELFRQAAAASRPELFVVIANWPEKRVQHWTRLLQARAIENQAYVIGVNRVGTDPFYTYPGRSVIVDYNGDILADAGAEEGVVQHGLDLDILRKYREGLPFLADLKM